LYKTVELEVDGFEVGGYHSEDACSGITVVFPTKNNVAGVAQMGVRRAPVRQIFYDRYTGRITRLTPSHCAAEVCSGSGRLKV